MKFLRIYRNFEALWDTCNEYYEENSSEHNVNNMMQKLTAAGLHIDNEESLKKRINIKGKRLV